MISLCGGLLVKKEFDGALAGEDTEEDGQKWYDLYCWLLPLVEGWVYYAQVFSWYGQQREVAEDITQEAIARTFHYSQRSHRGEVPSVVSLKSLSRTIAQNHFRDRRKKEYYLVRPPEYDGPSEVFALTHELLDPAQIALDRLMLDSLMTNAARAVAKFPQCQKAALLTDLANMSDFGEQPTALEQVFSREGICLRDYRQPVAEGAGARNRHAALLCLAYKRLRKVVEV
jgi:DNA-directed RNA polymerase specialized sigma24 family protein